MKSSRLAGGRPDQAGSRISTEGRMALGLDGALGLAICYMGICRAKGGTRRILVEGLRELKRAAKSGH